MATRRSTRANRTVDLSTREGMLAFEEAAKAYLIETTRTKETARKSLQRDGILTATGRLTKRYAPVKD